MAILDTGKSGAKLKPEDPLVQESDPIKGSFNRQAVKIPDQYGQDNHLEAKGLSPVPLTTNNVLSKTAAFLAGYMRRS